MGKMQRDKGSSFERRVVKLFKEAGYKDATRNYADKVDGQGVDVTAGPWRIQAKAYKGAVPISKFEEIKARDGWPLLVSKSNNKPVMATMKLSDLLAILQDVGIAWEQFPHIPF